MNDLSNPAPSVGVNTPVTPQPTTMISPSGGKEIEPGGMAPQEGLRDATGQEFELPKEVVSSGVKKHATTIPIPKPVAQMGVKPSGQNVPVQTAPTIQLPLTDDQIASGLQQSITNSIRWLSLWCVRQLKRVHVAFKVEKGKPIRTKM